MIKAVTLDLWGTLIVDSPAADERYRRERLSGLESTLLRFGFRVAAADIARAYSESGRHLARIWRTWRDVPVERHVTLLLQAVNPSLPRRVGDEALAALVEALRLDPSAPEHLEWRDRALQKLRPPSA